MTNPTVPQQEAEAEEWARECKPSRFYFYTVDDVMTAYLAGKAAGLAQAKARVDAAREGMQ